MLSNTPQMQEPLVERRVLPVCSLPHAKTMLAVRSRPAVALVPPFNPPPLAVPEYRRQTIENQSWPVMLRCPLRSSCTFPNVACPPLKDTSVANAYIRPYVRVCFFQLSSHHPPCTSCASRNSLVWSSVLLASSRTPPLFFAFVYFGLAIATHLVVW